MLRLASAVLFLATTGALAACQPSVPAGTLVSDWTYSASGESAHVPASKVPPQIVTSLAEWPAPDGPIVKLRFEIEIGDLAGDVHWNWPRHIRVTVAEPTRAALPQVDCMAGPPGTRVVDGKPVRPLGHDGVTPKGMVACFFSDKGGSHYVFDVDGDGDVTRHVPAPAPSSPPAPH